LDMLDSACSPFAFSQEEEIESEAIESRRCSMRNTYG
jgi:hypothetical protein